MNIQKRGFAYGAYVETEVTEGIMKRFRKTEDRDLGHIQRYREDYVHRNLIMVTGEIQTSAGNLDIQEYEEWQSLLG